MSYWDTDKLWESRTQSISCMVVLPLRKLKDVMDMENKQTCFSLSVIPHTFCQFMLPERSFHLNCKCSIALLLHGWVPLGMEKLQLLSLIHSVYSASHFPAPNSLLCPFTFFTPVMSFICFLATTWSHLWQSTDTNTYNVWSLSLLLKQLFLLFV